MSEEAVSWTITLKTKMLIKVGTFFKMMLSSRNAKVERQKSAIKFWF